MIRAIAPCVSVFPLLLIAVFLQPAAAQEGREPSDTLPGSELLLIVVEGDGAINNLKQRTAREIIVRVEDKNQRPVAGATVSFLLPAEGPGAVFADGARLLMVQTGEGGEAVAVGLRPNQIPGLFKVNITASYQGQTAAAAITQTNALAGAVAGAAAGGAAGMAAGTGISAATVAIVVGVAAAVAVGVGVGLSKASDPAPQQVAPTVSTVRFGVGSGPIEIGSPP